MNSESFVFKFFRIETSQIACYLETFFWIHSSEGFWAFFIFELKSFAFSEFLKLYYYCIVIVTLECQDVHDLLSDWFLFILFLLWLSSCSYLKNVHWTLPKNLTQHHSLLSITTLSTYSLSLRTSSWSLLTNWTINY